MMLDETKSPEAIDALLAAATQPMEEDELVGLVEGLRGFYPADSRLGRLLDELASDLRSEASREEIVSDAKAVLEEFEPGTSIHRIVSRVLRRFGEGGD
jgi:hypothetical protein